MGCVEPGELLVRQDSGDEPALVVSGSLDLASAETLGTAVDRRLDDGLDVTLDLADLAFCDSVGLQVLVRGYRRAMGAGRRFAITRASPSMLSLLDVTGLRSLFGPADG